MPNNQYGINIHCTALNYDWTLGIFSPVIHIIIHIILLFEMAWIKQGLRRPTGNRKRIPTSCTLKLLWPNIHNLIIKAQGLMDIPPSLNFVLDYLAHKYINYTNIEARKVKSINIWAMIRKHVILSLFAFINYSKNRLFDEHSPCLRTSRGFLKKKWDCVCVISHWERGVRSCCLAREQGCFC